MRKPDLSPVAADALAAAREAGLRYVSDESPGFRREGRGKEFRYRDTHGKIIRDGAVIERLRHLAIPPAWTDVWICPIPHGHIQAIGRDARGRKQYRYHEDWRQTRDATKFERMISFGRALPKIRRQVERDLRVPGLGRDKVIAAMVRLLEMTHIRVGNEEYARQNHSFGLSTLRDRHVQVRGGEMRFRFLGKSGKAHEIELYDPRVAKIVRQSQELPGQILFQYLDETGERLKVSSEDVNAYLREIAGEDFSAKDFRTWAGTVLAALELQQLLAEPGEKPTQKKLKAAVARVAEHLGNTPAICRKCYIHPAVMEGFLAAETIAFDPSRTSRVARRLSQQEKAVLAFLRRKKRKPKLETLLKRSIAQRTRAR